MITMWTPENEEINAQADTCKYRAAYINLMFSSVYATSMNTEVNELNCRPKYN